MTAWPRSPHGRSRRLIKPMRCEAVRMSASIGAGREGFQTCSAVHLLVHIVSGHAPCAVSFNADIFAWQRSTRVP